MIDEGYIKYQCNWIRGQPIPQEKLREINRWREKLYQLNLIGQYHNGIGFGNISMRSRHREYFIISGTNTGAIANLTEQHYTRVIDFDWDKNCLTCIGPIQASSESLTHAALYQADEKINAVIHIHHLQMWQQLIHHLPTTDKNSAYGTPEMARDIIRLSQENCLNREKIIIMSGHREGILTFGKNLHEAATILLEHFHSID